MTKYKTIKIIDSGDARYCLDPHFEVLGRMWDNEAEKIVVVKPDIEKDHACIMIVTADGKTIEHIVVGDEPIPVTNILSRHSSVRIGFTFGGVDGYTKNSEVKEFYFLKAQKPEDFVPVEPENKENLELLVAKGFVDVKLANNEVLFYGIKGNVVATVHLSGFVQEQSDLGELDNTKETFVKGKKTSNLENDGDGTSPYATENFVRENVPDVNITSDKLLEVVEDSDSIVVGTNEGGDKVQLSLDAEIANRVMKSLVVPVSAPSKTELVAVDDGNSQTMVEIGEGLKLENGVLSSTATGGESGGSSINVIDNLTSQSGTDALSAKQGNVLYNMIVGSREAINQANLNAQKQILLGADGVLNGTTYSFTVQNPDAYIDYRTNLTKFLVDLNLPIVGELDTTKEVAITFGDTSYYVFNILKGMQHATIADLHQVDKYSNETGYRFITEMTFFENSDITGFAVIPTISISDVLSLDSDQMDNYLAEGGLTQGQLAVCKKVITNGYDEGATYRFDIAYPDTYSWTKVSYSKAEIDGIVGTINTELENILGV